MNPLRRKEHVEGTDSEGGVSQALALRGRSVTINPLGNIYRMDLMDRMLFRFGSYCNRAPIPMQQLKAVLPPSFIKIFSTFDKLFSSIKEHEDAEEFEQLFMAQMDLKLLQMVEGRKQLYLCAGVECEDELQKKRQQIETYKETAETLYFSRDAGRELKRSIDEQMLALSPLPPSAENTLVLEEYWKMVEASSEGFSIHQKAESRLAQLFWENTLEAISSVLDLTNGQEKEELPKKKVELFRLMLQKMEKTFAESFQTLLLEENAALTKEDSLVLKYLILKGKLMAPSLMKTILREQGLSLLEPLEREVEHWIGFATRMQRDDIAFHQGQIEQAELKISEWQEQLARKANEEEETDYVCFEVEMIKIQQQFIADSKEMQQRVETRNLYKQACHFASENPHPLKKLIPELTAYDRLISRIYLTQPLEDSDVKIDLLSLEDPVAYFVASFQRKDEAMLASMSNADRFSELKE